MIKSNCLICNASEYAVRYVVNNYTICQCNNCSFYFVNPLPSTDEYVKFYQSSDYEDYFFESSVRLVESDSVKEYVKYPVQQILKSVKTGGKILDVGCGIGLFMKTIEEHGYITEGIEISEKARNYGIDKFKLKIYDRKIEDLNFEPASFDAVLMIDIIEHIPNLRDVMKTVSEVLKDKGMLIIRTPNIKSFTYYMKRQKWSLFIPPEHIYYFSKKHLSVFLERFNFKIKGCYFEQALSELFPSTSVKALKKLYVTSSTIKRNNLRSIGVRIAYTVLKKIFSYFRMGDAIYVIAQKINDVSK